MHREGLPRVWLAAERASLIAIVCEPVLQPALHLVERPAVAASSRPTGCDRTACGVTQSVVLFGSTGDIDRGITAMDPYVSSDDRIQLPVSSTMRSGPLEHRSASRRAISGGSEASIQSRTSGSVSLVAVGN